jgi:hypothetical protein
MVYAANHCAALSLLALYATGVAASYPRVWLSYQENAKLRLIYPGVLPN